MENKKTSAIAEAFAGSVKDQIANDRQHGWGAADSLAVIEDIVAQDAKDSKVAKKEYSGLSLEAKGYINRVINPSAFRQTLEALKLIDKAPEGARKGRNNDLKGLFA